MKSFALCVTLVGVSVFAAVGFAAESEPASAASEMIFTEAPEPERDPATLRTYRWEQVPGESLALVGPYGIVWQLNFSATLTKPYFHPLKTSDGRPLSWIRPADHVWHYGLWHSWKFINGVNYWEEDEKTGRAEGVTRLVAAEVLRADDSGAEVKLQLAYHPAKTPNAVVLEETVTLTIDLPADDGSYRIAWLQESRSKAAPVIFDRTPLPDEKNGKPWGGYGGLSFRASRFLRNVTAVGSAGAEGLATHRSTAEWMMLTGEMNGRTAAVTMFDHPKNVRFPTRWFVELRPEQPFWFINPAWLHGGPYTLAAGETLVRRHLVRIDRERPDVAVIEAEHRRFVDEKL